MKARSAHYSLSTDVLVSFVRLEPQHTRKLCTWQQPACSFGSVHVEETCHVKVMSIQKWRSVQLLAVKNCTEWGIAMTYDHVVLQILRTKYDMGYLKPSWLGRKWQPWYQDLLDLAGIKGMLNLAFIQLAFRLLTAL